VPRGSGFRRGWQAGEIFGDQGDGGIVYCGGGEGWHGVETIADEDLDVGVRQTATGQGRPNAGRVTVTTDLLVELLTALPSAAFIMLTLTDGGQQGQRQKAQHQYAFNDLHGRISSTKTNGIRTFVLRVSRLTAWLAPIARPPNEVTSTLVKVRSNASVTSLQAGRISWLSKS